MPSQSVNVVQGYLDRRDYAGGYRYIADHVANTPGWDPGLSGWFNRAAEINGSGPSVFKDFVFGFNARAAGLDPQSSAAFERNQAVSDQLARSVLECFIAGDGTPIPAMQLGENDISSAVNGFHNGADMRHFWAGGFFHISTIFRTRSTTYVKWISTLKSPALPSST